MFDSDDDEISLISDATFNDPLASINGAAPQSTDLPDPPSIAAVPIIDDVPVVEIASSDEDDDDDNSKKSQNFPTNDVDGDDEFLMADIPVECMVSIENNSDDDLMVEIPSPNSNNNELQSDASSASSSRKSSKREKEMRKKRTETLKQIETYNAKKAEMLAKVSFCYNPEASLVKKQLRETKKERRARLRAEGRKHLQSQKFTAVSEAMIRSQRAAKQTALDQLNKERQDSYRERREKARKAHELNAHILLEKEMQLNELRKLDLLRKQSKSIAQKLINSRVTSTELRQSGEEKTIKKVTPDGTVHEFSIKLFDSEDDFINHNLSLNYALFMS